MSASPHDGRSRSVVAPLPHRPLIHAQRVGQLSGGQEVVRFGHGALRLPPTCEHGTWTFAGSDAKRQAAKWRCPTGECSPASKWIEATRLHTLIPRGTARWKKLYRSRGSVERENRRLKHEWALLPLRLRGIERIQLHADLTILARLTVALAKAREVPLAA
jgi:hypothetical protein